MESPKYKDSDDPGHEYDYENDKYDDAEECFGELYLHIDVYSQGTKNIKEGDWLSKIIKNINLLSCRFGRDKQKYPNGISIKKERDYTTDENIYSIGGKIPLMIIRSYITKIREKRGDVGEKFTYLTPINIFFEKLDYEFVSTINKEAIKSIETILNHPHFLGCNNIKDIEDKIDSMKDLNKRFNKLNKNPLL